MNRNLIYVVVATAVVVIGAWMLWPSSKPSNSTQSVSSKIGAESTAKVSCPSKFDIPERPAGAPVDDVIRMRQGMKLSDAILFLKCRPDSHLVIAEENRGIAKPFGHKLRQVVTGTDGTPRVRPYDYSKAMMSGETGTPNFDFVTEKVMFWSLGFLEKEIVWGIWRSEFFKPKDFPAVAPLLQQLAEKYGKPNFTKEEPRDIQLSWVYDVAGQIMEQSAPQFHRCRNVISKIEGEHLVVQDCGLTVIADIARSAGNPLLTENVRIAVIDQGKYLAAVKEFERVLAADQLRQQADEAAKASNARPAPRF